MNQDCCLYCKHFKIWDDDPCCLQEDEWKLVLPSMICNKYDFETFKPARELHESCWNNTKKQFFETYSIEYQEYIDKYLEMFPEDKDLIKTNIDGRE